jgi:hypothetical protein
MLTLAILAAVVLVAALTRRCWDKSARRTNSVIGSHLSPRRSAPEDLP